MPAGSPHTPRPAGLVVTRFAPSPTGHLHIGGARTALFCWAFARKVGGHFMLRVEDTDQARSSEASARGILADLAWLGIDWDQGPVLPPEARIPGAAPILGRDTIERARSASDASGGGTHSLALGARHEAIGADPFHVGPFFQSQRLSIYNNYLDDMLRRELAYAAFETPAELDAKRKASIAAKTQYRYDRAGLSVPRAERDARVKAGEPHVVRFRMPDEDVIVHDVVLGEVKVGPLEVDDFVLRKADGFPTYHFGVVIDDETMGVTHVLRGQEHLYNTPKHVALQKALGFRTPVYAHMPLIFNEGGTKMSKRERDQTARKAVKEKALASPPERLRNTPGLEDATFGAWLKDTAKQLETDALERLAHELGLTLPEVSVDDFRRAGYLPEVITNFIALLGWSPRPEAGENIEKFDNAFLVKHIDLERIGKSNARFDRKKLLAFNNDAIAAMSDAEFASRWRAWCQTSGADRGAAILALGHHRFELLAAAVRPRSKTLREAADQSAFVFTPDDAVVYDAKAVEKNLSANNAEGLEILRAFRAEFAALPEGFDPSAAHALVEKFAAARSLNMGKIAQPLRVALTGSTVSPPIDATLAILGKTSVLSRIDRCLAQRA